MSQQKSTMRQVLTFYRHRYLSAATYQRLWILRPAHRFLGDFPPIVQIYAPWSVMTVSRHDDGIQTQSTACQVGRVHRDRFTSGSLCLQPPPPAAKPDQFRWTQQTVQWSYLCGSPLRSYRCLPQSKSFSMPLPLPLKYLITFAPAPASFSAPPRAFPITASPRSSPSPGRMFCAGEAAFS